MATKQSASYSELNTELDKILNQLESGELNIDEAVKAYERGTDLINQLQIYLKESENKVAKIKANFDRS